MNHEEIIAMAREAGFRTGHIDLTIGDPVPFIAPASGTSCMWEVLRFAALVAAREREAWRASLEPAFRGRMGSEQVREIVQSAIRARGQKEGA